MQKEYIRFVVSQLLYTDFGLLEYKGKTIYKYLLVIPPKDVKELGWKEGIELKGIVADGMYILRPKEGKGGFSQ